MGFFNFIETFFFISLGITFVLILLLVYHFKQRMSSLEQKCDTMFEIINNMVKELTMLRTAQMQQRPFGFSPATLNEFYKSTESIENKVLVSDNENNDGEDDDSGSETSGSEYDTEDEDEDGENDDEDGEDDVQGPIKIVNVNINDKIDIEEIEASVNDNASGANNSGPVSGSNYYTVPSNNKPYYSSPTITTTLITAGLPLALSTSTTGLTSGNIYVYVRIGLPMNVSTSYISAIQAYLSA
jgi:hypothetical protein